MTTRDWKFHVWKSTATSLSTALVDFTITNAQLAEVPIITGSRIRPLEGRTEARPWTVNVLDASSFFTKEIGDSLGRLDLMNRFVQAQLSIDGAAYAAVAGGRVVDAINAGNIATWQMNVQDEWVAGSNAMLFTTNTTLLYPPRPYRGYKGAAAGRYVKGNANRTPISPFRYWKVTLGGANGGVTPPLTDEGVAFIKQDFDNGTNAFKYLRFRDNGVDYTVVSFQTLTVGGGIRPDLTKRLFDEDKLTEHQQNGGPLSFWIVATSSYGGGGNTKTYLIDNNAALHAMTAPASPGTPLHIWPGWSSGNPWGTVHPMQVLKDVLDGVYSSSSESLPYYSTASFTGTADVRRLPTVGVAFRVTQPVRLRDWVEEHLLAPHGMTAYGDNSGKVAFKSILLADPQLGYSTANLFSFTSTNLTDPHPDWNASRREQVTQVEIAFEEVSNSVTPYAVVNIPGGIAGNQPGFTAGGDGIGVRTATRRFNHDRVQRYGTWPVRYTFDGYGTIGDYNPLDAFPQWLGTQEYYAHEFVTRTFHRYGDGPIQGTLTALPGASTVQPGDFVRLTLGSYPNISGSVRGGTRLVQILTKDIVPSGYRFEYLDAGSAAAPLTSPTLTLSTSTASPKHAQRVTVSAGVPSGGGVSLYMAESATTVAPTSTSAAWHPVFSSVALIQATGVYTLNALKSGTRFFVKGQASAPNRVRSAYTTPATKVTASITSPSALTMSSVKAKTAGMGWTVGDNDYAVALHVDTSTAGTPTTGNLLYKLPPGSNRTLLANLTPSQKYRSWVRHADAYGGFSGFDSTTFTMTSTASTANTRKAPALGGLYVVFGST